MLPAEDVAYIGRYVLHNLLEKRSQLEKPKKGFH